MVLCSFCRGFASSLGQDYVGDYYLHQPDAHALLKASTECELCRLIAAQFDETGQTKSILEEADNGYPTAITFVGIDHNGPWKYYPQYQSKCNWVGLVGLRVCCGQPERNDDWSCEFRLFTDHGWWT